LGRDRTNSATARRADTFGGNRVKASTIRRIAAHRGVVVGRCPVCGHRTIFVQLATSVREGLQCARCGASSRHRHVAHVLAELLGAQSLAAARRAGFDRDVYVAEDTGPTPDALVGHPRVALSGFHPGVALGASLGRGATCQDLERLTYKDCSFDIVVSEDVLEHVRDPRKAVIEIHRVLRPGGVHVFTIPFRPDRPTLTRVDTSGDEDVHLMEPEFHGDAIRGQILAYRTYGYDLFEELAACGFATDIRLPTFADRRGGIFESLVLISRRLG
jgi:SAM-dependent methyltransferase